MSEKEIAQKLLEDMYGAQTETRGRPLERENVIWLLDKAELSGGLEHEASQLRDFFKKNERLHRRGIDSQYGRFRRISDALKGVCLASGHERMRELTDRGADLSEAGVRLVRFGSEKALTEAFALGMKMTDGSAKSAAKEAIRRKSPLLGAILTNGGVEALRRDPERLRSLADLAVRTEAWRAVDLLASPLVGAFDGNEAVWRLVGLKEEVANGSKRAMMAMRSVASLAFESGARDCESNSLLAKSLFAEFSAREMDEKLPKGGMTKKTRPKI